jgi:uncharacterized membrane protein
VKARIIHRLFRAGLALKGFNAGIEALSGLLLAAVGTDSIKLWAKAATQSELLHDPQDVVATALLHWAQGFSVSEQHFYAFYLLSHGVVKLALVIALARGKIWAYPAALAAFAGFILYQSYRISYTHSPGLALLTAFDCVFVYLVWREYRLSLGPAAP